MPSYLVETYLPRGRAAELGACEARAKAVAQELTREGTYVHFDRSIHLPEDETCFFVLDAASSRVATLVAERAGLEPIRVVEAVPATKEES